MDTKAYVLIETNIGQTKEIVRELQKVNNVITVDPVTGPYDIIAIIQAKNLEDAGKIVTDKIHSIPGMIRTITCLSVPITG
tara:strand:+ start:310 stop:552 length:243 start_codon:yes stop_codon:yes gene_type:complete